MVRARLQCLAQFLASAYFYLDGQPAPPRPLDGSSNAAGCRYMVVLDEYGVEKSHSVVGNSAGRGGSLFEGAEPGGGLAGIEDAATGALDRAGETARHRSDAA